MKYLLPALFILVSCGEDASKSAIKSPTSPISLSEATAQIMPNYQRLCLDNNRALLLSKDPGCQFVNNALQNCSAQTQAKWTRLNNVWDETKAFVTSDIQSCLNSMYAPLEDCVSQSINNQLFNYVSNCYDATI